MIINLPAAEANKMFQLVLADDQDAKLASDFNTGEVRKDSRTNKPYYTVEVVARVDGKRDKGVTSVKVFDKPNFPLDYLTKVQFTGNVRITHYLTPDKRLGVSILADGIAPVAAVRAQNVQPATK